MPEPQVTDVAPMPRSNAFAPPKGNLGVVFGQLQQYNTACIFVVRSIGMLGFRSRDVLKEHFSYYGTVTDVIVPTSHGKVGDDPHGRIRPSALGFVVMEDAVVVWSILQLGGRQTVNGHVIRVSEFQYNLQQK